VAQCFDEAELMERVDNDVAFLAETVGMLTSDGPVLIGQLRSALASGDAAGVGRAAHAIKGMVSNFCSPQTQSCALEVERMGKGGDLAGAPPAVEALDQRLRALTDELEGFIRARG